MKTNRILGEVLVSGTISATMPANMPETLTVLASSQETGHIFRDLRADIVFVRSVEEFQQFGRKHGGPVLVTNSGMNIARKLLETGGLQTRPRIFWSLSMSFSDTLRVLKSLELPETLTVCGFSGTSGKIVLETSLEVSESTAELASFMAGVKVGSLPSHSHNRGDFEFDPESDFEHELVELRGKYLSLLLAIDQSAANRIQMQPDGLFGSNERRQLEDKLILLNRRYSSLERRYEALSNSRLGRITQRVWMIKRRGIGIVSSSRKTKA